MRFVLVVLLTIFINAFSEEESITSETNEIPIEIQKELGIKTEPVRERVLTVEKTYPAIIKDDLTLSEAVFSPVEGLVKKLFVKEGDRVKKGQKLAYIYSPEIAKIITKIKQAQVKVKTTGELFKLEEKLYRESIIPYTRYFRAKIDYENAKAELRALEESLNIYGEIKDKYLVLKSHMNGYIALQNVILGDSVGIDKMLFKIHSHRKLWTVAFVPITEIKEIKKGVQVSVLSPIGKTKGIIDFISHKVDPDTKRVEVRIITDNKNEVLKPNMFVDVKIPVKRVKGLFIPASAVAIHENDYIVFVKEGNRFEPVHVKLGERLNGYYRLISGLRKGQEIVVQGTIHLKSKFFGEAEE